MDGHPKFNAIQAPALNRSQDALSLDYLGSPQTKPVTQVRCLKTPCIDQDLFFQVHFSYYMPGIAEMKSYMIAAFLLLENPKI